MGMIGIDCRFNMDEFSFLSKEHLRESSENWHILASAFE